MGESNTVVSDYTMYRHLEQYCFHPAIYGLQYAKKGLLDICIKCRPGSACAIRAC